MPGRGNNSVEFQVSLGLQGAQQQIDLLHRALEESVKIDSNGFKSISKMLENAQSQAEKLSSKMGEAFKTSSGSKNFLKDYQKMLETLSQIRSKMGNLGFEDIKFSVADQGKIDDTVKRMQDLEQILTNINKGKAIDIIVGSSVENVDILKKKINDLSIDTSKLTFDSLRTRLADAAADASNELNKTEQKIKNIETVLNNLDAKGLEEIQSKIGTSAGLSVKLIDDKSIDSANEKLRQLKEGMGNLSDKAKASLQVDQKTGDISKFIETQTENIKASYQKQIEAVRTSKETVDKLLTSINNSGSVGKNNRTYYNNKSINEIINSEVMQASAETLGIDLSKIIDETNINNKVRLLKEELGRALQDLQIRETDLTNLRDSFESKLKSVFEGLTTSAVSNVKVIKDKITNALNDAGVDPSKLKDFGFDISSISAGETLASIYDRLKTAVDNYTNSLADEHEVLNSSELLERRAALEELEKAQKAANAVQGESSQVIKEVQEQIAECRQKIEELVKQYQELTGKKVEIDLGNTEKNINNATKAIKDNIVATSSLESKQKALSNVQSAVTRWMGFYQVLNLTKRAINDMKQHIQELDAVMTKIAVVTNMTQNDLWNQIGTYSEIARQYGVAIKGVYEVSQLYYQQGLNKGDVMNLTTETLKMARIAGIDYATAADYMTTAVRGFKLEMEDAAHVTDVFSNLAAHTASSTEELAVAISKTAASAASVGASFEATSAMMSTMIATTRESATNIGTALKSIIARYGELKKNMTGTDAEGEEYSLNKVDTALQSVGISIHDAAGQFRDFDDVILELAEAWSTIDKNTQRYIATVMAGNRQQSRFLALVSNVEEYKRALELANNSNDVGELQVLKTLDSVDAKIERMKVTIQEFYTSSGIQDLYKGILDVITNVISAANDLPKTFGNLPVTAIAVGLQIVSAIKNILILVIAEAQSALERIKTSGKNAFSSMASDAGQAGSTAGKNFRTNFEAQMKALEGSGKSFLGKIFTTDAGKYVGTLVSSALSMGAATLSLTATNAYGASRSGDQDRAAAGSMFGSAALNGISGFISGTIMSGGSPLVGALNGAISLLPSFISALSMHRVTLAREIELQTKVANESKQKATQEKGEVKELEVARDKLNKLQETSIESAEAMQEYKDYMNQLADTYPELISRIELTGDKTIILADLEEKLAEARIDSAEATIQSLKDEIKLKESQKSSYQKLLSGNGLPSTIESGSADFSFLEEYIWTWGSSEQKAALDRGDKYAALLDLYNTYAKNNGLKQHAKENLDWVNGGANRNVVYSNLGDFNNLQNALINSDRSEGIIRRKLKDNLSTFLEENKDSGITLSELTGGAITELSDLDNNKLKTQDLIDIIYSVTEHAQNHINSMTESISGINDTLNRAELQLAVDTNIGTQKINGKSLSNYSSFITSMIEYQFGKGYNWTSKEGQAQAETSTDWWTAWLEKNTDNADWLMQNLNFADIRDSKGLIDLLSSHGIKQENVGQNFLDNIIDEFNKTRENVQDAYQESLKDAFSIEKWSQLSDLGHYDLYKLFNNNISEHDNLELDQQLAKNLQKNLYQYKKLIDNDQQILAENYLISLENSFKIIGSYNNEQQDAIQSIIENIDWSDSTSLSDAAESLRNVGPEYEGLAHELDLAAERFATNITTRVMQLRDSAATVIKSIEKVMDNAGKATKSSDALENVNTMLKSYTGEDKDTLDFTSIYEWNKELNGYVLTEKGIQVWLDSINGKNIEELKKAEDQLKELKSLYGGQDQQGVMYKAEKGLERDTVLKSFKAIYSDEQGKLTIDEDTLNARTDAFMAEYEDLRAEFSKQTDLSWEQFIDKKKEALILTNEKEIENLKNMPYQEIVSQIASIDYKSIAGGTATQGTRETLEALLKEAGVTEDRLGTAFNDIWTKMLAGDFESFNNLLTDFNIDATVSNKDAFAALQEEYQQYSEGLTEILTKPALAWSDKTKEIANITDETNLDTIDTGTIAIRFLQRIADLVGLGAATIEDQEQAIINAMNQLDKEAGIGRQKQLFDAIKDGFTNDEIVKLGGINADGSLKQELKDLVEKDEVTGEFKIVAKGTTAEILQQFADALGITLDTESKAYKEALRSGTDEAIAEADKNDAGKQAAAVLSTISSATIGTRIKTEGLPPALQAQLDADGDGIYEIMSEYERDKWIMSIELAEDDDIEWINAVKQAQKAIKQKRNLNTGLQGIISKYVSDADAQNFVMALNGETEGYEDIMRARGYAYNKYTQQWEANKKVLENEAKDLARAQRVGASDTELAQIKSYYANLRYALEENPAQDALLNLLSNYENVSNDALAQFAAQFDGINIDALIKESAGVKKLDIASLRDNLIEIDAKWAEYFDDYINELADKYINNISTATSLVSSGTTSIADTEKFIKSYQELGFEGDTSQLFNYNSLLQAWTLDGSVLKDYIQRQVQQLELLGYDTTQWYKDQIQSIAKNVDISSYIAAEDRSNTGDAYKELTNAMYQYYKVQGYNDTLITSIINQEIENLNAGGSAMIATAKRWAERQGKTLTSAEIDSMLSDSISRITDKYTGIIEELVNFTTHDNLSQVAQEAEAELSDANGAVTISAENALAAAEAFLATLAEQIGKAGYTLEDYNATAKSILDKTLFNRGGNVKALVDFASNDINSDALEGLANNFGLQLTDLVNVTSGQVLGEIGAYLDYNSASGNYELLGTFNEFTYALEEQFGIKIDRTSKEYIAALKSFNDTAIEKEHEIDKAITEELKEVAVIKPGDKINLAQTYSTIFESIGSGNMLNFRRKLAKLGADWTQDGILSIEEGADIPGIIQKLAQEAANAGQLIPEELAELNDALVQALRDITNIISSGIGGSISGEEKRTLTDWAKNYGITNLQFMETADGYQLASESAKELYQTINNINSLQGQVVFEALKDNLIETDEHFKSASANAAYIRQLEIQGLSNEQSGILQNLNGNVNMFARPVLQNADGTISTLLTATEESRNYESEIPWVMNITPITPTGKELNDTELQSYIQKLVEESSGNMDEMIRLDKSQLGLIIEGENTEIEQQEEILKAYDERAEKLHNISDAIEQNKQKSAEELALAQKIAEARGLQEDNSFKFMEQDIPSGQKNPLNYWENWGKAFKVMNEASQGANKGKMDYSDFYNLITEMGNLAQMTGQAIPLGQKTVTNAETAAALIEEAAGALQVQADGSLKIDLSQIGVDFVSGADAMAGNIDDGIHQVAQSQIDMLDALIGLLEAIVTMEEAFKNLDVDDDLNLDISEIFNVTDNSDLSGITDFSDKWKEALQTWRDMMTEGSQTFNEDFTRGMESIKFTINGQTMSLRQVIETDYENLKDLGLDNPQIYQSIMNGIWEAARNGDYDETTVKEIIMDKLSKAVEDVGGEVVFDMGNYTFIGTGTANYMIDWDSASAKAALAKLGKDATQKELIEAIQKSDAGEATAVQIEAKLIAEQVLKVDERKLIVETEDGKQEVDLDNLSDSNTDEALAKAALGTKQLKNLGAKNIIADTKQGSVTGKIQYGEVEVALNFKDGKIIYSANGVEGNNLNDLVNNIVKNQYNEWEGHNEQASDQEKALKQIELTSKIKLQFGISDFELTSQSFDTLDSKVQQLIEDAISTGDRSKVEAAITLDPKLKGLEELSLSELEEKLGKKETKITIKISEDSNAAQSISELDTAIEALKNQTKWQELVDIAEGSLQKIAETVGNVISNVKLLNSELSSTTTQLESIAGAAAGLNSIDLSGLAKNVKTIFDGLFGGKNSPELPDTNALEFTADTSAVNSAIEEAQAAASKKTTMSIDGNNQGALGAVDDVVSAAASKPASQSIEVGSNAVPGALEANQALGAAMSVAQSITAVVSTIFGGGKGGKATGNIGLAKGNAQARGTLMGELGPELVVSNGQYFVVGQEGAEFVDLKDDAIVFNHLQTEQLLKHGMSKQRGQAITNERNAVAFAQGNINGPALASAKAVLGQLKQLRAMWQSMLGSSVKDLAGMGGSGGGGGGENKQADPKAFIKQLEIWYNWLQRIAVLEEKINYEEAKRNEISSSFFPNGKEYVQSQKESLDYLKEQAAVQMSLVESQQEYFEQRRAEMNSANNPFSALYTFDEYGQLKYKDGGLEQLSQLVGRNSLTGKANMSAEEQYRRLVSMGYGKYMDYDSSGNPIDKEQDDWYVSAVQAFWDKIDSDKEEMQSLHDSIEEHKKALLEEEEKMNEILHEIEENQLNLEQKVLKAIEESRQREIDELQKQRDALEESSQKLIDGLSEQLQKERDMYSNDESDKELTSLQRQLAILQRSGGSASQIASLQKEISQKQQDAYFEAQQAQIDALQEASDKQLEKLDQQIDIMSEALEYEKLHGMLWEQVYEVLNGTPMEIAQFIKENTSDYWSQSAAQVAVNMREDLFEAEKFKAGIDYLGGINQAAEIYSKKAIEEEAKKKREEEEKAKAKAAAAQSSQSSSSGSGSSSGSSGASTPNSSKNNNNNNNNTSTTWKYDDNVSGRMYEVDSNGKATGAIKYDDTGLVNINTAAGQKALEAARTRAIQAEEKKIESAKSTITTAQATQKQAQITYSNATSDSAKLAAAQQIAAAQSSQAAARKQISSSTSTIKNLKNSIKATTKASGGYVGHGIYELGERGTETVLTAEQTQVLRNNILSNRPNSLISLLKSYNEGYNGINDNIKDVHEITDNSTVIEQATVEMHVSKIANDYDAQRAGEKALEKMISIARKTQAQNRVGR